MVGKPQSRERTRAGWKTPLSSYVSKLFNQGASGLVVVLPITSKEKGIPFHVELTPPEGGLKVRSFIKCEDVRSISVGRFEKRWGTVSLQILAAVEDRLRILMGL